MQEEFIGAKAEGNFVEHRGKMQLLIRKMELRDLALFQSLFHSILDELHHDNVAAFKSYQQQYTKEKMEANLNEPSQCYLVAEVKDEFVGFGLGRNFGGVGLTHWIGVKSHFRKQKVGTALVEKMMTHFETQGCHKLEVYTYQNFPELSRFYQRFGFEESVRWNNHWHHLDLVYLLKNLPFLS